MNKFLIRRRRTWEHDKGSTSVKKSIIPKVAISNNSEEYLSFGFTRTYANDDGRPVCV